MNLRKLIIYFLIFQYLEKKKFIGKSQTNILFSDKIKIKSSTNIFNK